MRLVRLIEPNQDEDNVYIYLELFLLPCRLLIDHFFEKRIDKNLFLLLTIRKYIFLARINNF